jgi:multicomponent Na+:H+ antiporter subunit E
MTTTSPTAKAQRLTPFGVALRTLSFVIAWWAFTEGNWREWGVAVVVMIAASWASFHILPLRSWRWSLKGLLQFAPYFLWQSFWGGVDVAWRAFHPAMPLNTGLKPFKTRLPGELPRVFLAWTISLLPGTASVKMEQDELIIHVLNVNEKFEAQMRVLENRIAAVFGIS